MIQDVKFYLICSLITIIGLGGIDVCADEAIEKLHHKALFRGDSAKPYYEAMDGVGYLLYALLEIDEVVSTN